MVTLEQIKLLESKIARAIGFVSQVTEENGRLKKRNEALEEAIAKLKEEKAKVEEGIVSVLGRLNQFEDAIGRSLAAVKAVPGTKAPAAPVPAAAGPGVRAEAPAEPPEAPSEAPPKPAVPSVFTVDEEPGGASDGEDEEFSDADTSGEAELDIF
ncbi:MAG: cell division protein ZapB [Treponema sp.]|jgi:FtsZ-binding cell division protein ZapB|nr:cell division protein ZapB [Treponema sp.]